MKELLALMARYNRSVNRQLFDLLEKQDAALLDSERGSYFGSIMGLLNHILLSDLGWLSAYRDSPVELAVLWTPVLDFEHPGWKGRLHNDLATLRRRREETDELFIRLIDSVGEEQLAGDITLTHSNGKTHTFPFGKILLHLFNHQTHHRGAISQILDAAGVEHDYSNLMRLLME